MGRGRLKCTKSFVGWGSAPDPAYIVYILYLYILCNWPLPPPILQNQAWTGHYAIVPWHMCPSLNKHWHPLRKLKNSQTYLLNYYYNRFTALWILSRTTWVSQHQKRKTNLHLGLLEQEIVSVSSISWAICKSAPHPRHINTPAFHYSVFYRPDALPAAQPTASKH